MLRGILQSAETSYTTHQSHFPYRQPREMKFGGDVLQMLTYLMVQPVCLWLFWMMSKKNEKTRLVSPGCMIFLSQVKKKFLGHSKFCVRSFANVFTSLLQLGVCFCTFLCEKSAFFHVFSTKSAKFGHFEAKHLHERERSWC